MPFDQKSQKSAMRSPFHLSNVKKVQVTKLQTPSKLIPNSPNQSNFIYNSPERFYLPIQNMKEDSNNQN